MFPRDNIRKTVTAIHYPVFEHQDTLSIAFLVYIILYIGGKQFRCSVYTFVQYIFENVYKFHMEVKKSGMQLSLNRVWDRTAALTGVSRSITQKIVEEKKKAQDEQQQPKQTPSSTSKVSLNDLDQGVVRRTIASMLSLNKVLPTIDNIRTELKHSIGYTGSKGRLYMKFAYTRCGVNQKVLMERSDVALSRIRYLRMVRELREVCYTVVHTNETFIHTSNAVPKCWQDSTTGLKIPYSKGNLRIVELHDP